MDEGKTPEKPRSDHGRVPSPGSASSIHSIRPLEWDSGADIGYQNTSRTDLSTVERMALANGSAGLYKTTETVTSFADGRRIGNPLAESSPFVKVHGTENIKPASPPVIPLVNYSISEYSIDEYTVSQLLDSEVPKPDKPENSKSLEDLRLIRRVHSLNGCTSKSKSHSSQNVSSGEKHQKRYASSSSVATVIPQELRRQVSNKSIQVDENSLLNLRRRNEVYQCPKDNSCSIYTINSKSSNDPKSRLSDRESNSESVDGNSFEYVPGSQYNSNHTKSRFSSSSSDINTLCTEVVDGVDLITKYVNNLNVTNKKKIIKKVAQSLMNQLQFDKSTTQGSDSSKSQANLQPVSNQVAVCVSSTNQLVVNNDMLFEPIDKPNKYPNADKTSTSSKFDSTSVDDVKTSESFRNGDSNYVPNRPPGRKSCILESTDFSKTSASIKTLPTSSESHSYVVSCTENSSKDSQKAYTLEQYLAKEREVQLLWIKSGIDHLNNLKKLYCNQKILKKDLVSYKNSKPKTVSETYLKTKQSQTQSSKSNRTLKITKSIQTSTSDLNDDSRCNVHPMEQTSRSIFTRKLVVKKYSKKIREKDCRCRNCKCCVKNLSENKENIDISKSTPIPESGTKKPISYTVLFDKTTGPCDAMRQQTIHKSFGKVVYSEPNALTENQSKLKCKLVDSNPSLQEYLLKNKPEYVDRAEFRRQCLSEIAQLRELRDKSKKELMSLVDNTDESDIDAIRQHLPPAPLTVLRIFNDRTLRQQTLKKYQQLPEVQMKKMEQKRRDNNRRNQIMAKIFTKRLQRKVLKGQVDLANSVSVISA